MSERDELRDRVRLLLWDWTSGVKTIDDQRMTDELADAVLAEIERFDTIMPKADAEILRVARSLLDEPTEWDEIKLNKAAASELLRLLGVE